MTVEEILNAAQTLSFEERKQLIHELFAQMPETGGLAGTITDVRHLETGELTIQTMVRQSLDRTAQQIQQAKA